MAIPIGKMRDPITILEPRTSRDSAGGEKKTYSAAGKSVVWIKALTGREFLEARQVVSEVTHKIIGHYDELKDITTKSRIKHNDDGREFDVTVVLPSDIGDVIDIFAVLHSNE